MQHTFFLMRHGQAESNVGGVLSNSTTEYALTAYGRQGAEAAAEVLRDQHITHIYASPVRRTRETAEIIGNVLKVPVQFESELHEVWWPPHLEGKVILKKFWPCLRLGWWRLTEQSKGGESVSSIARRMVAILTKIDQAAPAGNILIVSHGDPLWQLESALGQLPRWQSWLIRQRVYYHFAEVRQMVPQGDRFRFVRLAPKG